MKATAPFDILGIGTIAVDEMVHVAHYPGPDEKQPILCERRHFGGLVATALATAARLSARCAYAGVLGEDGLSAAMKQALVGAAVDCSRMVNHPSARPIHSIILVDDRAHTRNIFYNLTDFQPLPLDRIDESLIASARVLLIDQWGTPGQIRAATLARNLAIPVLADLEWPTWEGTRELLALVDHVIVPRDFAAAITSQNDPAAMVERLHDSARVCTAVTCGANGCFYRVRDEAKTRHQSAFKITPVETTGCGDVFHGAYAATLAAGSSPDDCILRASAAAAHYAGRPTGWDHLPSNQDIKELLCR